MHTSSPVANRHVPIWRTVAEAYRITFSNIGYLARIAWAWALITMLAHMAFHLVEASLELQNSSMASLRVTYWVLLWFVTAPLIASICVAWHRFNLRGERWPSTVYLRFDKVVLRYLACVALLSTIGFLPFGVIMGLQPSPSDLDEDTLDVVVGIALAFAVLVVGWLLTTKMWLTLPAQAVERPISLQMAWTASEGNLFRLAIGSLVAFLPCFIASLFLNLWIDYQTALEDHPQIKLIASAAEDVLLLSLGAIPMVSFLSLAYRQLLERVDYLRTEPAS